MDFISRSFEGRRIHLALFQLTDGDQANVDALEQRRQAVAQIAKTYKDNLAIVDSTHISSLLHLNIAVARAFVNQRDGKLKTNCLGQEVIYHCSPNHSIQHCYERFGVKNCTRAFFTVFLDFPAHELARVKADIKQVVHSELTDLNAHLEFSDVKAIMEVFDLKEPEKHLPHNGVLNSIYTKLALKNL